MIRRRLNFLRLSFRLTFFLLPAVAFLIAGYVRFLSGLIPLQTHDLDERAYVGLLVITSIVWAIATEELGLSRIELLYAGKGKLRRLVLASSFTYGALLVTIFFYRAITFSRLFVVLTLAALFVCVEITNVCFRVLLDRKHSKALGCIRVLVIGADRFAEHAAARLREGQIMPCRVTGFVRLPDQQVVEVKDGPVFEFDDIRRLAIGNEIDDIVIAISPSRWKEIPALLAKLEPFCVPVRVTLDFGDGVFVKERLLDFGGILMLDLHSTPAESIPYLLVKRLFDVTFSFLVLLLTAPFIALISIGVWTDSPGTVFHVQERVGLNGKVFRMYKFRSMKIGDPADSETRWTTPDDPRRTKFGAFLRRTNLDELPQFWNVLMGHMSVVGPRPERPFFVEKFLQDIAKYNSRHYLKVGITGWAQVNGLRGDTSIANRLEYDLYYLRNWSFTFDLQIILLTILRGFSNNAY